MRCGNCGGENESKARFCGFCGNPFPDHPADGLVATALDRSPGNDSSQGDARQASSPERATVPPAQPTRRERSSHARLSGLATTRWLCAAVTLDAELERRILNEVLEEQLRAVITTPGVDLVTVLKCALAAHRRRLICDVVLLLDLCALVISLSVGSFLLFIALLIVAWGTVFVHRYTARYGATMSGLRAGNLDPRTVHSPQRGSFAEQQLQRIAAIGTTGNVTLYSGFAPFCGYGTALSSWSFAIDITRPPQSMTGPWLHGQPRRFSALDIYDYVKAGLLELDLPDIELTDRLFVNSRDAHDDRRFIPDPDGHPVTSVTPEVIRQLLAEPEEWARPYLTISSTSWRGDLVVTTFIRFLVSRTDLFVEAAHNVVPPFRAEFKAVDERDPGPDAAEFFALAGRTLQSTLPRLFGSVREIFRELTAGSRRKKKQRRVEETHDYGALVSARELAADTRWQRYFQKFDDERFVKVIEQRIFRSLVEFLKEHNIDTSSMESRVETLINNGVMFGDNAKVEESQVGGAGTRLAGLIPRVRGEKVPEASKG